jgi:hypothetical protein
LENGEAFIKTLKIVYVIGLLINFIFGISVSISINEHDYNDNNSSKYCEDPIFKIY